MGDYVKKIRILILVLLVFFAISLISLGRVVAEENYEDYSKKIEETREKMCKYYSEKFEEIQEKIDKKHRDDDGNEVDSLKNLIASLRNDISGISQTTKWNATASENFKKHIKEYLKINSVYKNCSHDFTQVSCEYNGWKNEKVDPTDENDNAKRNESEYASEITSVDKTQQKVKKELDSCRKDMEQISSTLFNNDSSESVYTVHTTYATQILDFVANFCILGGSVWMILGTITLAGSLKDKNGPTLQTSIWQIIGGTMIVFATYLFRNSSQYPNLLNEVLWIASQFTRVGGALWLAWGVIILAGAIKDKTGPALQSAIWQIVGGIMIVMTSYLFMYVV